jgi:hypothetical protein
MLKYTTKLSCSNLSGPLRANVVTSGPALRGTGGSATPELSPGPVPPTGSEGLRSVCNRKLGPPKYTSLAKLL